MPHRSTTLLLVLAALSFAACEEDGTTTTPDTALDAPGDSEPDTAPTPVVIGASCDAESGCEGGICATLLPGGSCTLSCETEPCPDGSVCREINNFPFCLASCSEPSDCRTDEGYTCVDGACDKACQSVFDCDTAAGEVCRDGLCVIDEPEPDRLPIGNACISPDTCISTLCLAPQDGGVCSRYCDAGLCPEGWTCTTLTALEGEEPRQLCAPPDIRDQHTITPTDTGEASTWSFDVGPDVASLLIVAEAENPRASVILQNIVAPTGETYAGASRNGLTRPLRLFDPRGHGAALIPQNNNPDLQVIPGTWSFQLLVTEGEALKRVQIFTTLRDATGAEPTPEPPGTFDINIFIPPGSIEDFTAETAPESNHLRSMLEHVEDRFWNPHGLAIGTVRYFDIGEEYLVLDSAQAILDMFATVTAGLDSEGALNVFLARELQANVVQGFSSGIPGAVGLNGSTGAGVIIIPQGIATSSGDNLAHELGHYLGLFHVSEDGATFHDVIADTPECLESPSLVPIGDASDCWKNIMYPLLLTGFIQQELSPTQGRVIRLNPRAQRGDTP